LTPLGGHGILVTMIRYDNLFAACRQAVICLQHKLSRPLCAAVGLTLSLGLLTARADWPQFRGPSSDGHVSPPGDTKPIGLPLQWSETNNIKWKTPITEFGWSTPAILDGQIWITMATLQGNDFFVLRLDPETGKICYTEKLFHCDNPEPLSNAAGVNCYATPSVALEPGRAYVHFGTFGTACLDTKTDKVIWKRSDVNCRHYRGPSSTPVLFGNLVILTLDGVDVQYVTALDKQTGKTVWKTDRSFRWDDQSDPTASAMIRDGDRHKAHSTPLIVNINGKHQMLSTAARSAYAYDPQTGKELWRIHHDAWSAAPIPVYSQGLAFLITGSGKTQLLGVRVDGQGDVTDTHVAWHFDTSVARTASPILVDGLLYMVADDGTTHCLEAATGTQVWRQRLPGKYAASPIYGDGRLYFCSQQGVTTVVKPGRTFESLATNTLEGSFMASPAVSGKALYLRTKTHLYRVESAGK
jgi:outer membrane protein assembly factor BamB